MRYVGGKTRLAKRIADQIANRVSPSDGFIWSPFCGGLSVEAELARRGYRVVCSDLCLPLISLYCAVAAGWNPPRTCTKEERDAALALPDSDPFKAFARFGCGFGGNWSSGYARDVSGTNYAAQSRAALLRDVPLIVGAGGRFAHGSFLEVPLEAGDPSLIYADPPYRGVMAYSAVGAFDHAAFDRRIVEWSRKCHHE